MKGEIVKDAAKLLCALMPVIMPVVLGCAPAYHSYSGCYVDCQYCPPPPLPYTHYDECVCHSCAAQPYLHVVAAAPELSDELEAPQPPEPDESEE